MCELVNLCKDEGCPSRYSCKRFLKPYDESNNYFESLTRKEGDTRCRYFIEATSWIYSFINKSE